MISKAKKGAQWGGLAYTNSVGISRFNQAELQVPMRPSNKLPINRFLATFLPLEPVLKLIYC